MALLSTHLKDECDVYFSQSPRTSPDCHYFSNITESGLESTLANSLRTLGCTSSGPLVFCIYTQVLFFSPAGLRTPSGPKSQVSPSQYNFLSHGRSTRVLVRESDKLLQSLHIILYRGSWQAANLSNWYVRSADVFFCPLQQGVTHCN